MSTISRRDALAGMAGAAGAWLTSAGPTTSPTVLPSYRPPVRLKQSVCRWCYAKMPLEDLCREAKAMGPVSVEILEEKDWPTVKRLGLTCTMPNGPSTISVGFNRPDQHERLTAESERLLPIIAGYGFPNMIVFSGNRGGMSDGEGIEHCVAGIRRIVPAAERHGVTVCLELLNSKVDHPDYQCDHTAWGAEVVKRVNSPRFKLLYDIYHMQIMEGDVIRTIRDNFAFLAHFHTGGVPGRHEIDETQELNYRRVMQAIADLAFGGYVAQEFVPTRDPMTSLRQGVAICDL